jgi:hypothetical protein
MAGSRARHVEWTGADDEFNDDGRAWEALDPEMRRRFIVAVASDERRHQRRKRASKVGAFVAVWAGALIAANAISNAVVALVFFIFGLAAAAGAGVQGAHLHGQMIDLAGRFRVEPRRWSAASVLDESRTDMNRPGPFDRSLIPRPTARNADVLTEVLGAHYGGPGSLPGWALSCGVLRHHVVPRWLEDRGMADDAAVVVRLASTPRYRNSTLDDAYQVIAKMAQLSAHAGPPATG